MAVATNFAQARKKSKGFENKIEGADFERT